MTNSSNNISNGSIWNVFISAKNDDIPVAQRIFDFLQSQGIHAFFGPVSLPQMGQADYREQIDNTIETASHMILVGSSRKNIESFWVKAEWSMFINEKRAGRKQGNLITLVVGGLEIADLPIALRQFEVIDLEEQGALDKLLHYVQGRSPVVLPEKQNYQAEPQGKSPRDKFEKVPVPSRSKKMWTQNRMWMMLVGLAIVIGLAIGLVLRGGGNGGETTISPVTSNEAEIMTGTIKTGSQPIKKITIGVNSENPPWVFMQNDKMDGFEVDIIEEFARRAGYEIDYKTTSFTEVLSGIQTGQWDIAMSSLWIKPDRVPLMDFSDPYYDSPLGLVTMKNGSITSLDQLEGKVIGVISIPGYADEAWLQESQNRYGPYEIKRYDFGEAAMETAANDITNGQLDGLVTDAASALYFIKQNPSYDLAVKVYIEDYNFAQALAFQKGSALRAEFNKVLNEMKMDGSMRAIYSVWFNADPLPDSCLINECTPYLPNLKPDL